MRECKGLYASMCDFILYLEKISASLAVLGSTVHLPDTVVLLDIHSIEYLAQVTQTPFYRGYRYMNTRHYLLFYIGVVLFCRCMYGV